MEISHDPRDVRKSSFEQTDRTQRPRTTALAKTERYEKCFIASKNLRRKMDHNNTFFAKRLAKPLEKGS